MTRYRSAARGTLPDVSGALLGDVRLPRARLIVPDEHFASRPSGSREPCLWVSEERLSRINKVVASLIDMFGNNGLWPLILESLDGADERPWLAGELDPSASTDPSTHDVTVVLRGWWAEVVPSEDEGDEALSALEPFGREFPGLAPSVASAANDSVIGDVVAKLTGRLGLIAVHRPADVLAAIGWLGPINHFGDMGALSAVLRSWEERFDAFLVAVGFDTITLAIGRPPSTLETARALAAEHFAACSDIVYQGADSIEEYAGELVDNNRWQLWWD